LYRKMRKNTKSVAKAKAERQRRKQVLELAEDGLTQRQIAERVGVSGKTVARDLQKLTRYRSHLAYERGKIFTKLLSEKLDALPRALQYLWVAEAFGANLEGDRVRENQLIDQLLEGNYQPKGNREDADGVKA
jgi:transcriptional regulator with XRE-family HTH domain